MSKEELERNMQSAKQFEEAGDFLAAAFQYKFALEVAGKLGDKKAIRICKEKVVETNKKSRSQYHEISAEAEVPTQEIDTVISSIIEGDLQKVLKNIGLSPFLYPHFQRVTESAKNNMPVTFAFVSLSAVSDSGHVVKGGGDREYSWFMRNYAMHQDYINKLYLQRIFSELIKDFDKDSLLEHLRSAPAFSGLNLGIVEVGVERFFAKDFVSALHILVPHFEAIFLAVSDKMGLDTVALNRGKEVSTQARTLSAELLSSQPFQEKWGRNLCEQLKFVFFDQLGYTLRHKIAHGFIMEDECHEDFVNLVVYFYLVLAARVAKSEKITS